MELEKAGRETQLWPWTEGDLEPARDSDREKVRQKRAETEMESDNHRDTDVDKHREGQGGRQWQGVRIKKNREGHENKDGDRDANRHTETWS